MDNQHRPLRERIAQTLFDQGSVENWTHATILADALLPLFEAESSHLREALDGCVEHMEWSTPHGKAAYEDAKRLARENSRAAS